MSCFTHPFRIYVLIISENWSYERQFFDQRIEINCLVTLAHPSTIRSLADLDAQIRVSMLAKPKIDNNPRELKRVRGMRITEMAMCMASTGSRVGPVDRMVLGDTSFERGLRELYERDWEWDYIEVKVDPERDMVPVAGPSGRPSSPIRRPSTSGSRPLSPMFGDSPEAVHSRADARRRREERERFEVRLSWQEQLDFEDGRRRREERERLKKRFD